MFGLLKQAVTLDIASPVPKTTIQTYQASCTVNPLLQLISLKLVDQILGWKLIGTKTNSKSFVYD